MARGKTKRPALRAAKAKTNKTKTGKTKTKKKPAKTAKPIELYYWPTPNGFKISIMLEECGRWAASDRWQGRCTTSRIMPSRR